MSYYYRIYYGGQDYGLGGLGCAFGWLQHLGPGSSYGGYGYGSTIREAMEDAAHLVKKSCTKPGLEVVFLILQLMNVSLTLNAYQPNLDYCDKSSDRWQMTCGSHLVLQFLFWRDLQVEQQFCFFSRDVYFDITHVSDSWDKCRKSLYIKLWYFKCFRFIFSTSL